ncbi:MAG: asparagine synthetase B family protein, partial [bacterium]
MCGIAGFYGDFNKPLLARMGQAVAHRGPDGDGLWVSKQGGVGFAHRRLSLIDLSEGGRQPMEGVGGRFQTLFNGEIYNYKSLVKRPELMGYSFNRNSDTAVLAPLFAEHGAAMLNVLEGMFAFALHDTETDTLFLAREHAGIVPLYYAITPQGLVFASEAKALAAVAAEAGIDLSPDTTALQEYVSFLWTPSVRTPVVGIRKLRPGHYLTAKRVKGKVKVEVVRWWAGAHNHAAPDVPLTHAGIATLWDEVVAEQCTADVPAGAFLSGGVDSSAVVASMARTGHTPPQTYCIAFEGAGMAAEGFEDDEHYAKLMAAHANVPLKTMRVDV